MPKKFKSVNKAINAGHLRVAYRKVFTGKFDSKTKEPVYDSIPYLERKVNIHKWVFYSGI